MDHGKQKALFNQCFMLDVTSHEQLDKYFSVYNESPTKFIKIMIDLQKQNACTPPESPKIVVETSAPVLPLPFDPVQLFRSLYTPTFQTKLKTKKYQCRLCRRLFRVKSIFRTHRLVHICQRATKPSSSYELACALIRAFKQKYLRLRSVRVEKKNSSLNRHRLVKSKPKDRQSQLLVSAVTSDLVKYKSPFYLTIALDALAYDPFTHFA